MRRVIPIAEAKSKEYGIRFNNWMPIDCGCGEIKFEHGSFDLKKEEDPMKHNYENRKENVEPKTEEGKSKENNKKNNRMICYAPWQRLLLDNDGQVRPYAICSKWIGHTKEYSLAQMWNNEAMQMYRRKIANNNFMDLCQPECISGQIRNKLCRPVEDK